MLRGQLYQTHFLKELGWLAVFSFGRGATFTWVQARVKKRVKGLLYRSLLRQDIHFFEDKENKPGSLASRLHLDVDKMGQGVMLNCNLLRMKEQILDCQAETKRLASQSLGAIRVVRSCRAERYEEAEYTRELNHMADIKTRKSCYTAIFLLLRRVWIETHFSIEKIHRAARRDPQPGTRSHTTPDSSSSHRNTSHSSTHTA
ncbi:hypothetical protein CRUP_006119 [Coryphaenoides rupestris]|nr:hypothetical protein CRUP_006119 [Coryphaenoides rupestris]